MIKSENFKDKDAQGEGGEGYQLDKEKPGMALVDPEKFTITTTQVVGGTISVALREETSARSDSFNDVLSKVGACLSLGSLATGLSGETIPTDPPPTPRPDELRFIAATQRKVEELEKQVESLINEVSSYTGVDHSLVKLAKDHLTIGHVLLQKILGDCQLDDGK